MGVKAEERSAAREFLLARLAVARGQVAAAATALDIALGHFADPGEDTDGSERAALLEEADAALGEAARAVQLAMPALADIDPKEGEPEDEDEDDDDDEEDEEDEDEEEDERPRGRKRR